MPRVDYSIVFLYDRSIMLSYQKIRDIKRRQLAAEFSLYPLWTEEIVIVRGSFWEIRRLIIIRRCNIIGQTSLLKPKDKKMTAVGSEANNIKHRNVEKWGSHPKLWWLKKPYIGVANGTTCHP